MCNRPTFHLQRSRLETKFSKRRLQTLISSSYQLRNLAKRSKIWNSDNQSTTPPSQSHELPPQISQQVATSAENDIPPDGGYGWVCVATTFWINATWGINSVRTFLHTKITFIVTLASGLVCVAYYQFIIDQKVLRRLPCILPEP
jgi:hypothetical protein